MIAVTGATGSVGGGVARLLAADGHDVRLLSRDPSRLTPLGNAQVGPAADYDDGPAMRAALEGAGTLFLVSAHERTDRVASHRSAIDAAVAAGVERVVYLSFLNCAPDATFTYARDHFHTEAALRESGVRWTALRDAWYQAVLPHMVGEDGALRGPAGDGRVSCVAPEDVVATAAAVLADDDPAHDGRHYDVTGPEALDLDAVAAALTVGLGRPVRYERETVEEAYASRADSGAPRWELDGWVSTYTAIAAGELETVSGDVEALTGRPPTRLADWLAERAPE